jgi:hypothetical protein
VLKLLSGSMMLGLGLVLLWAPDAMSSPWVGVGLLLFAVGVTTVATLVHKQQSRKAA